MTDETCVCLHCCWIYIQRAVVAAFSVPGRFDWFEDMARCDVTRLRVGDCWALDPLFFFFFFSLSSKDT